MIHSEGRLTMKTILLGYDDGEPSMRALIRTAEIAKAFQAKVHVTSVAPVLAKTPRGAGPYDPSDPPAEHQKQLQHAQALLRHEGLEVTLEPAHGNPAEMILEVADNVDADLIILGTNERPFIEHALGMSVSGSVSRKAHRDVLIVH
jgi:nucleotide-binding universal stress UspA family protein